MSSLARFSLPQYELMVETGVFAGKFHQRVELIRGEIRQMNPIGPDHAAVVNYLARWTIEHTDAARVICSIQNPIRLPESGSSPEPDLVWLVQKRYRRHPLPGDILLLIEVADTTLPLDLGEKATLYAEAGIPEYWVVDIEGRRLLAHRQPAGGGYSDVRSFAGDDGVAPLSDPKALLKGNDLFSML